MYEMMYELVYVMNAGEIYLYVIYICCGNCWIKKTEKKRQYAGSLPSATDGKELFAVRRRRQRSHVAANCASWELTHLVSLPTVADGKEPAI